ncbi:MAG: UbiD family decarboxylase [Firmicutes bacterium]|nr:UbiD family decarboxylase [Bacillota bacterium]
MEIDKLGSETDRLRRKLRFVGLLSRLLEPEGVVPILVGGTALEFYTFGEYSTADVDLVLSGREEAARALEMLGFQREGRHWYSGDLDLAVEIPDNVLAGALEKTVTVSVEGEKVRVIGPEDLIVDRLAAAKFWKARTDLDWAAAVLLLHQDRIDPEYLEQAAAREGVSDFLVQAMKKRDEMSGARRRAPRFSPGPERKPGGPRA